MADVRSDEAEEVRRMLEGQDYSITLDGPTQALLMSHLWEALLCRVSPRRDQRRREEPWDRTNFPELIPSPELPGWVWESVYGQTLATLPFEMHVMLWLPFVDAKTGHLPTENLSQHIVERIPEHVLRRDPSRSFRSFVRSLTGEERGGKFVAPKLSIGCASAPVVLRDPDGAVHCHDGPAVVFADGSPLYYWRGQLIPTKWIPAPTEKWIEKNLGSTTLIPRTEGYKPPTGKQALAESNVELRRVAVEIIGWDTVVMELDPTVVDQDPDPTIGTLLRAKIPAGSSWEQERAPPQQFLRVQCGTGRWFSLCVPPTVRTAREANAWTYGLSPEAYQPEVRT